MKKLTKSLEDYLEAIYLISLDKKVVRVKEVASMLEVSTPSVVDAISKLTEAGYVIHEKYGYLNLSKKGLEVGKGIYKKHEELYDFFRTVLGISDKTAKKDACRLEHFISSETLEKMKKFMRFIETCPEGYPNWLKSFNYYSKHGKRPNSCLKE